jgi:hypothetical protein
MSERMKKKYQSQNDLEIEEFKASASQSMSNESDVNRYYTSNKYATSWYQKLVKMICAPLSLVCYNVDIPDYHRGVIYEFGHFNRVTSEGNHSINCCTQVIHTVPLITI